MGQMVKDFDETTPSEIPVWRTEHDNIMARFDRLDRAVVEAVGHCREAANHSLAAVQIARSALWSKQTIFPLVSGVLTITLSVASFGMMLWFVVTHGR